MPRPYRRLQLAGIHRGDWPAAEAGEPRFVHARKASRPGHLPFFSKVGLLHHVQRLRAERLQVAFARPPLPSGRGARAA